MKYLFNFALAAAIFYGGLYVIEWYLIPAGVEAQHPNVKVVAQ